MAPSPAARHRTTRPLKSILKTSSTPIPVRPEPLFATSKKDKRRIKHAQLMSKVTKSSTAKPHRRRPNKKLITTLDSLVDALPENDDAAAGNALEQQANIIKRKSMKSRPGAMKRREKLDKAERDRFARNMAQMAGSRPLNGNAAEELSATKATLPSEKWLALRSFIGQTLEQKPELKARKT